jgi:hypothetical protein
MGNKVVTRLSRRSVAGGFEYGSITVKFDHPVSDDPANPYGIDLNVFGNSFYTSSGTVNDTTNMDSHFLVGGIFAEPVVVSVSPDNVNWYTYADGPYGDTAFPTQGYEWNAGWTSTETDFTKPVNPTLGSILGAPGQQMLAADAMASYVRAGGGTGVDLAESGFESIQYVRVESTAQFRDGEIDAFADVRPMRVGEALSVTPANVTAGTPLYFQSFDDETHTAVVAKFTTVSDLGKLATADVVDSVALAALPDEELVASFQLDVSPLIFIIGGPPINFTADYQLSPGDNYLGAGSDLELLEWDGAVWQPVAFEFDGLTSRLTLTDWSDPTATLAIMQDAASGIAGDFDGDGRVDTADYVVWRRGLGTTYNETHYNEWRANFGAGQGGGNVAYASSPIPEPNALALAGFASLIGLMRRKFGSPPLTGGVRGG